MSLGSSGRLHLILQPTPEEVFEPDSVADAPFVRFIAYGLQERLLALSEAIAVASSARREELCRILVERVTVRDREIVAIDWTPQARPFFEKQRVCPQGGSGTRPLSDDDPLAWYAA